MNRNKIMNSFDKTGKTIIAELQESLLIIKNAHQSNELIVNKLQKTVQNEKQFQMCSTLQKDMELINNHLDTLLENITTVKINE